MPPTSDSLEEGVRRGDPAALADFMAAKRQPLLAFIIRQLGPALRRKVEPDDILQEVSIDCLRSFADVDLSERDPFSWLCQVAERRIIDAHRRFFGAQKRAAGREQPLAMSPDRTGQAGLIEMLVVSMTSASQAFSRGQREFLLLEALEKLPEESRQALRWRYVDGLSSKEIAERLKKSDGSVRVLLSRSLRRLEELLGPGTAPR